MRPCHLSHPDPVPHRCRHCWLFVADPRYSKLWGYEGPLLFAPPPAGTGRVGTPPRAECRFGLKTVKIAGMVRDYRRCEKGHGEVLKAAPERGKVICSCWEFPRGCKGCPDYLAELDD